MKEEWKAIQSCDSGYQVSSLGNVRSVNRISPRGRNLRGRNLSPGLGGNGYFTVALPVDGKFKSRTVHSLVAEAFMGPCPEGEEVRHVCGDKSNNIVTNLEYGTRSQNNEDLKARGERYAQTNSTSGVRGVIWNARCQKWCVQVWEGKSRKLIYGGYFSTIPEAKLVADKIRADVGWKEIT